MYKTHEMRMVRAEESGLEEWACPTCGRRMLLRWPPNYEKQVIEPGDEKACHVGSAADDTPPEPADTTPQVHGETEETTGETTRRWHNGRRRLRETGVEAASAPVVPP